MFQLKRTALWLALMGTSSLSTATTDIDLDQMVVTGTRSEALLLDLAGNTAKVSQQEIELVNPDHIEEILLRVPGMNLQRGNGAEMTIALRSPVLTGPGAGGAFLFLEDGIPMRAPAFVNNNGLSEAHYEQAGSIEVIRGPGSAFYGSNAVHGVVNVLTAAPSKELERKIDLSVGSDDVYKFKGTISNTIGAHGYRVSFTGIEEGGWRADSGLGEQKLSIRHDYAAENGDTFKTIFHAFNLNQETAGFLRGAKDDSATPNIDESLASASENLYKNTVLMKTNPDPDAYRDWWSVRLSTRWDHVMSDGNILSITPYIRSTEMNFRQHYLPSRAIEKNGHDSLGVQSAYYLYLDGGHELIWGLDTEYTEGHLSEIQDKPYFTYAGFNGGKKKSPQGFHYDYDVDVLTLAPFVHAEWQLNEKLRATTGLRFEHTRYDYKNRIANNVDANGNPVQADGSVCPDIPPYSDGCLYRRPENRQDIFNNWSPKLGLSYRWAEKQSVYASYSRGNRAPQTTDLYRLQTFQNVGEIRSEKADSFEIGFRGKTGRQFNYDVAVFYMKKKNFFFRDSNGNNVTDGKTRHYGVEAQVAMPLGASFDIAGTYTYAAHEYDFNKAAPAFAASSEIIKGKDVDTAPRTLANVRLGWNFITNSRAELEWSHVGRYYTDPAHFGIYKGHDLFNLRVNTQITPRLALHGQIRNLFNTRYADRADYAFGQYRFFPGRERNYEVGLRYRF